MCIMSEITTLIDGKSIMYTGLFRMDELYSIIRKFVTERGFFALERKNQQDVLEQGKQIMMDVDVINQFNHYAMGKITLIIHVFHLKDKEVTVNNHKQKYQHGELQITFSTYLETDYRNKWENSGFMFLMRTLTDKFIKRDDTHALRQHMIAATNALTAEIQDYLNMTRLKFHQQTEHKILEGKKH